MYASVPRSVLDTYYLSLGEKMVHGFFKAASAVQQTHLG